MKNSTYNLPFKLLRNIFITTLLILLFSCNDMPSKEADKAVNTEIKTNKQPDILWAVKAILPDGQSLDIKAVDANGKLFDVNAIQDSDQDSFLDIKAYVGKKKLPVKVLLSKDNFSPVKAIDKGGITYAIKAITPEGEKLDVKGVMRFGNIVALKVINEKGNFYEIKALSPSGKLNDILGVKINIKEKEMTLNGFSVYAHVKAMHQSIDFPITKKMAEKKKKKPTKKNNQPDIRIIWNIKAITPDGKNLPVKAFDTIGNTFDVKGVQDSEQNSFMNVKAIVNGSELPIKIIQEEGEYSPLKAIDKNGNFYTIKAIDGGEKAYTVMGTSRSGNIINIKAVTDNGSFYAVKAFSPKGKLNDLKGIKIFDRPIEMNMRGAKVYGHVKAIKQ